MYIVIVTFEYNLAYVYCNDNISLRFLRYRELIVAKVIKLTVCPAGVV